MKKRCRDCATYKAGLCGWYNFGDNRPPRFFSPASDCGAFRDSLDSDEVCFRCICFISAGGYLGQHKGYCVVDAERLPVRTVPEDIVSKARVGPGLYVCSAEYMSYAALGFYGYDPLTIVYCLGLSSCKRFEKRPRLNGGLTIAELKSMTLLEKLTGKPRPRLCYECGVKVNPEQQQNRFEYLCPEHGLMLVVER